MVKILDTTLRDGSYVIDFQFSAKDTSLIAAKLDDANIPFIEVGHGLGMNAGTRSNIKSAESDEMYLEAARSSIKKGKWGMFFIPGIGRIQDIELAAKYGMDFIRIGTNVTEVEKSREYIKKAKELGLYVFANYMKTYALSPDMVGVNAAKSKEYGADVICIVDSAGGMLPEDVEAYINAIRKYSDMPIGFHGHNNLGMAIANSLRAIELGAAVVDTSVRGMGRSSGNTITEMLILALKRRGIDLPIEVTKLFDLAEKIIDPLLKNYQQVDSIGIISGFAQFHSSFLEKFFHYAEKYQIDLRELIVRVSKEDKVNPQDYLIEGISKAMAKEKSLEMLHQIQVEIPHFKKPNHFLNFGDEAAYVAEKAMSLSKKWKKLSVFNIVQGYRRDQRSFVSSVIHEGQNYIVSSAEVYFPEDAKNIATTIDGMVDFILLDIDNKSCSSSAIIAALKSSLVKSNILRYSDIEVWSRSVLHLLIELLKENLCRLKICIVGDNSLSRHLSCKLRMVGVDVEIKPPDYYSINLENYSVVVFCDEVNSDIKIEGLNEQTIIDGLIGSLPKKVFEHFHRASLKIFRPEMHLFIHSEISAILGCNSLVSERQGLRKLDNLLLVSGGVVGPEGAVVVDSYSNPTKVYGIADGKGFLIPESNLKNEHIENIKRVEDFINVSYLSGNV